MVDNIEIIKENKVYKNQFGCLFDDDVYFRSSDTKGTYVRWKWNTPYSVGVLPIMSDGNIVMIESFRHSARKTTIEVPKGFGKEGVEPQDVAKAELIEEAGLVCSEFDFIGTTITDPAFSYNSMHLFIARNCEQSKAQPETSEEIVNLKYFPLAEIQGIPFDITTDTVSLLLLSYVQKG